MREETRMQSGGAPSSGSCCSELQRDLGLVCAPQALSVVSAGLLQGEHRPG